MNEHTCTFSRRERVKSRKLTDSLFKGGNSRSMAVYPVRMVYEEKERCDHDEPVVTLMSVSKRHFRRAVKRNRVKRQLREAYRLRKQILLSRMPQDKAYVVAFIWMADELADSATVGDCMERLLTRLAERNYTRGE